MVFKDWLKYGINFIAIDTLASLLQHLLLYVGQGATTLPPVASLAGQQRLRCVQLPAAIVVLGKGLSVENGKALGLKAGSFNSHAR